MSEDIDLVGLAAELHRSLDWTQRHWRELVADKGMPPPFIGGGLGSRPWWSRAAVLAWKQGRVEVGGGSAQPAARPANDPMPARVAPGDRAAALLAAAGGRR